MYAVAHKRNSEGVIKSLNATLFYDDGKFASLDCGFDTNCRQTLEIAGSSQLLRGLCLSLRCSTTRNEEFDPTG